MDIMGKFWKGNGRKSNFYIVYSLSNLNSNIVYLCSTLIAFLPPHIAIVEGTFPGSEDQRRR